MSQAREVALDYARGLNKYSLTQIKEWAESAERVLVNHARGRESFTEAKEYISEIHTFSSLSHYIGVILKMQEETTNG